MKNFRTILEQMKMFTVYRMNANSGKLSNKEHLNDDELDQWMSDNDFATILVIEDNSKKYIVYDNVNGKYKIVKKGKTKTLRLKNFKDI